RRRRNRQRHDGVSQGLAGDIDPLPFSRTKPQFTPLKSGSLADEARGPVLQGPRIDQLVDQRVDRIVDRTEQSAQTQIIESSIGTRNEAVLGVTLHRLDSEDLRLCLI